MKYIIDTNVLLTNPEILEQYDSCIPSHVLREVENLERTRKSDSELQYQIRKFKRVLDSVSSEVIDINDYTFKLDNKLDSQYVDNILLQVAVDNNYGIITNDRLLRLKCKIYNIETIDIDENEFSLIEYKGYRELLLDMHDEEDCKLLSKLYKETTINHLEMLTNEYLVIKDKHTDEIIDKLKWYGDRLGSIRYKQVSSKFMGKVKPRNIQQELLFDLLQDNEIKIKLTAGKFGSGKDYIMLAHALDMIKQGKYRSLIYCRNNFQVANSNDIGFLPGTADEKLLPFAMPIADHVGGQFILESMLKEGTIQIQHLGFLRGRNLENCIIYVSEIENMTKEHIQLILGRVAENTIIMMNGDMRQVDSNIFKSNSGMKKMIENLSGNKNFGYVELLKSERSEVARMADLLD